MSARKSSHRTIFLIVSSGSPLALIASSLRSTSKKPFCPMTRSLHPPITACGHRVRFVGTWREEFFEAPTRNWSLEFLGPDAKQFRVRGFIEAAWPGGGERGLAVICRCAGGPPVRYFGPGAIKCAYGLASVTRGVTQTDLN